MGKQGTERGPRGPVAAGVFVITAWVLATALPAVARDDTPDKSQQSDAVDAATKKLLAAHGLFQRGLYKLAAQEYDEFLKDNSAHPDAATARYALAVCRYKTGDFEQAIPLLRDITRDEKFKQRDEALAVLGHCHLARKQYDPALAAFDELLAKHPQSKHAETAALNKAQALYLAGKPKDALAASQQFLDRYPQSAEQPTGLYFLALSEYALNQPKNAGKTLSKLLQSHAESRYSLDATLLLGQCLEATGDLPGAAELYRRFIAAAPPARKADGQYSLGVALYKSAQYDGAAEELRRLANDDHPKPNAYAAPARLQLGLVYLAAGKTDEARRTLQQVVSTDPARRNDARYALAQCDIADKRFDAARSTLDELAAVQPPPANLPQILLDRAVCAAELGRHDQAASEFESFLARNPNAPQAAEATYRQAFSLHKLGKYDQSHALAARVEAMKPSDFTGPAAELDAESLFLAGKYPDAAAAFGKLASSSKEEQRRLRFELRRAQCAYFAKDYPGAADLLVPLARNEKTISAEELHPALFLLGDALIQQGKFADAVAPLEQFVRVAKGDKQEAQFKLGLAQLRAGNADEAEQTLGRVASGPSDSPWVQRALLERGQLLYKQKKPDGAEESLRRVLAAGAPEELSAPAAYLLGWVQFDAKRYPQAADRFKEVVDKYPKHALAADACFQRGVALKEANQNEPALAALQRYIDTYKDGPHAAQARQLAAAALTALNRHDQAEAMLATLASSSQSASDTVLYDLAWAQRNRKDNKAAAVTYRKLIQQYPQSKLAPAARTELAEFVYADGNYSEAAQLLEPVVSDEKADPKTLLAARYRLGWCYEKLGQKDKAGATLAGFAEKHGDSELAASALLQAGLSFAADGRMDKAEQSLKQMLSKFPQHKQASVALLKLGEVQAESKDFEASRQSFEQFLSRYGTDPLAYRARFGVGWALENQKRYDNARAEYKKVIAATNTETAARAQFQIGETYLAEGKFDEAVAALLAVEDVYAYPEWSARALLEAGRTFEQMKQPDQAKAQYKIVTEKYKDAPEAAHAGQRLRDLK